MIKSIVSMVMDNADFVFVVEKNETKVWGKMGAWGEVKAKF